MNVKSQKKRGERERDLITSTNMEFLQISASLGYATYRFISNFCAIYQVKRL